MPAHAHTHTHTYKYVLYLYVAQVREQSCVSQSSETGGLYLHAVDLSLHGADVSLAHVRVHSGERLPG